MIHSLKLFCICIQVLACRPKTANDGVTVQNLPSKALPAAIQEQDINAKNIVAAINAKVKRYDTENVILNSW